jgi:hypothetical protein
MDEYGIGGNAEHLHIIYNIHFKNSTFYVC